MEKYGLDLQTPAEKIVDPRTYFTQLLEILPLDR